VEVWYDGADEQYFKGGWSQIAVGTSKFDVRIYDDTQCQKEYEAEVHFH
jgi:hypothetical protein